MLDDRPYMRSPSFEKRWTAAGIIIAVNAAVFLIQQITSLGPGQVSGFEEVFSLDPTASPFFWTWQLFTFQFLHGDLLHIIINCAMIYIFGRPLEAALGQKTFLELYFASGVMGGVLHLILSLVFSSHFGAVPVVGASAGVFGLIAAFAALNWEQSITALLFFIIPITMKAKYLVYALGAIAIFGMLDTGSRIAHGAHLGGMLAGLAYVHWMVRRERSLFNWSSFTAGRSGRRDRDLLKIAARKRALWPKQNQQKNPDLPPAEFISREVDPILDKISAHGIHSLTERERKILEAARSRMGRR